jgi:hypothetical protein
MPTLTTATTVTFPIQIDQVLTLTTNFGAGRVTLSAQRGGDVMFDYTGDQLQNAPVFSSGTQGLVTITHLSGSLTYNVTPSTFPLFDNTPRVLFQNAIPFILAGGTATNQFTISATGALSALPTLPITSGPAFFYMPTGITGLTSGWYYGTVLSATTAQISTSRYTSGDPLLAIPAVFTNPSGITAGNYSQTTATDIQGPAFTLTGGSMGPNGSLRAYLAVSITASANNKTFRLRFGTTGASGVASNFASASVAGFGTVVQNVNSQSVNKCLVGQSSFQPYSISSGGMTYLTVNTAADVVVNFSLNIANAAEFAMTEYYNIEVLYGA